MPSQLPIDWSISIRNDPGLCIPINDEFLVQGKRGQGAELTQARLDADLGYAYPTLKMPKIVKISTDESDKILAFHFGAPIDKDISVSATCEDGWWKFTRNVSNQYTGDGGQTDELTSTVFLAKSSDDALIVHVLVDAVDSSLVLLKQREHQESWAKYERSNSQ